MFQYTKEVILNDEKLISVANGVLTVKGYGDYKVENIVDGKIFRTECEPGSEGKVELTASQLGVGAGEKVLTFRVVTSKALAEFASPNWNVFGKPIIVGYNAASLADVKTPKPANSPLKILTSNPNFSSTIKNAAIHNIIFAKTQNTLFNAVFLEFLKTFLPNIESIVNNVDIAFVIKYINTIENAASINTKISLLVGKMFIMQKIPRNTKNVLSGLYIELSFTTLSDFIIM